MLTTIILTKNEERHIARAIDSVAGISDRIVIVDSGSTDRTIEIARKKGTQVLENPWVNYATQFNWAIGELPSDTQWVLRLDADEFVTAELAREIAARLSAIGEEVGGINVSRRMCFLGCPIRWGGVFPIRVVRLFRYGRGRVENRWMDEHILIDDATTDFRGEIIDDNRNSLTWWTEKHNSYASREVVDLLALEYDLFKQETVADLTGGGQAGVKRWLKEKVYARLPLGMRALIYFLYRFVIRLGFLDGRKGVAFHVLQGFWYRYLVDMKLQEVRTYMRYQNVGAAAAIREVLGIDVEAQR